MPLDPPPLAGVIKERSLNGMFILEEIGEMLIGKTYVWEIYDVNDETVMGGFKYKGKEGVPQKNATIMRVLR